MTGKQRMPKSVLFGGPAAVLGYWLTTWLLENEPDHWLIRGLTRTAEWIGARLPRSWR